MQYEQNVHIFRSEQIFLANVVASSWNIQYLKHLKPGSKHDPKDKSIKWMDLIKFNCRVYTDYEQTTLNLKYIKLKSIKWIRKKSCFVRNTSTHVGQNITNYL